MYLDLSIFPLHSRLHSHKIVGIINPNLSPSERFVLVSVKIHLNNIIIFVLLLILCFHSLYQRFHLVDKDSIWGYFSRHPDENKARYTSRIKRKAKSPTCPKCQATLAPNGICSNINCVQEQIGTPQPSTQVPANPNRQEDNEIAGPSTMVSSLIA